MVIRFSVFRGIYEALNGYTVCDIPFLAVCSSSIFSTFIRLRFFGSCQDQLFEIFAVSKLPDLAFGKALYGAL